MKRGAWDGTRSRTDLHNVRGSGVKDGRSNGDFLIIHVVNHVGGAEEGVAECENAARGHSEDAKVTEDFTIFIRVIRGVNDEVAKFDADGDALEGEVKAALD